MSKETTKLFFCFLVSASASTMATAQNDQQQPLDLSLPKGIPAPHHLPHTHFGPAHDSNPLKNNLRCKFSKSLILVPLGEGKLYIVGQGNIITYKIASSDRCEESALTKIAQALGG